MSTNFMALIVIILLVLLGFLIDYYRTNIKLEKMATELIAKAEEIYKDSTTKGGTKFEFVVNELMKYVPKTFEGFITKEVVQNLVQRTFDDMKAFAKLQLDKWIN